MNPSEATNGGSPTSDRRALLAQALRAVEEMKSKLDAAESALLEPVAIVGAGCRFPGGASGLDAYWRLLMEGRDAVSEIPRGRWQSGPEATSVPWYAGLLSEGLDEFDPRFFRMSAREACSLDPQQRLLLEVGWEALENAGQAPDRLSGSRTAVFIGITTHDYGDLIHDFVNAGPDVYTATGNAHNAAAGRLSYFLGLHGPSAAIDTACSSSLVAIHLACQSLRLKECTVALAGGVNALLAPDPFICFSKWGMMAPDGRCKTFDARANGFVRSEGCGIVILKRLRDAVAAGDRVLAVIRGSAVNQDGRSSGLTVPNGPAQEAVVRLALENARIEPRDIGYIEAHGTGTSLGDPIEAHALAAVFGPGRTPDNPLRLGSVKTNLGHLESASGVAGLLKVVLSLQHGCLPAHLHWRDWNPDIDWKGMPVAIPTRTEPWPEGSGRRAAGVSSFGFSGTNAHVILEEAPEPAPRRSVPERTFHLLAVSAQSDTGLAELTARYGQRLDPCGEALPDACFTANTGRAHFAHRAAFVACSVDEMAQLLKAGRGVAKRIKPETRPVFLFSGQGAQYAGMGRELYESQPVFRAALEKCEGLLRRELEEPLLEVLYGGAGERLKQTAYTQPALFAIEYALAELWKSWGIEPSAVLGHSVGEYAAACVAGMCSLEEGLVLIAERGRRMQALPGAGAMAAVLAGETEVRQALAGWEGQVSVAAVNAPGNVVISGERRAVEAVSQGLRGRDVRVQELAVSHAFHSAQMEPMAEEFARRAAGIGYRAGRVPLISSVTGERVGGEELREPGYWRRQVREAVQFRMAMEGLGEGGHRVFVEIGPGTTLLGLGRQCLEGKGGVWLASLRRGESDWRQMLNSLGELYEQGAEVDWAGFDQPYDRRRISLPTYPFERQRYWLDAQPAKAEPAKRTGGGHPLLGGRTEVAGSPGMSIWETDISIEKLPYLADHCVQGSIVVPATAYMEMATAAARDVFGETAIRLSDLSFKRPLVLSAGIVHSAQISLSSISADSATVHLHSRQAGGESAWKLLFTATVTKSAYPRAEVKATGFEEFVNTTPCQIGAADFYDHFQAQGNRWGPTFRGVVNAWVGAEEAWSRVEIPAPLEAETDSYWAHPAVADACGHVLSAINAFGGDATARRGALVGQGVESVTIWQRPLGTVLLCHARVRAGAGPNILMGDVRVFDEAGHLVSELVGARLHYLESESAESRPENWLYQIAWRETPRLEAAGPGPTHWIILADRSGVGQVLAEQIRAAGVSCLLVTARGEEACAAVKTEIVRRDGSRAVICLWGLDVAVSEGTAGDEAIRQIVHLGGVPEMLHAFTCAKLRDTRVWLVTRGAQSCERDGMPVAFWQTPVWGLGRTFSSEHPELWGGLIDIDPHAGVEANAGALWIALCAGGSEDQIALRGDRRLSARLERQPVRAAASLPFRSDGCYLITGGLGGLGLEVARWMVRSGARRLILISRTALPPRDAWRDMNPEDPRAASIKAILAFEQEGAVVHTPSVDVADGAAVGTFVQNWERECQPPIRGVVHAAGTLRHGFIAETAGADFEAMLRPKLGAWFLHKALECMPLDFFVLFSSASSILSSAKLGGYAASNALLDGLAAYRNQLGRPCLSINWGMWTETGMSSRFAASDIQALAEHGMGGLPTARALESLAGLICSDGQVAVLPVDWRRWAARYPAYAAAPFLSSILDSPAVQTATPRNQSARQRILDSLEPDRLQVLLSYLTATLEKVLRFPSGAVDPSTPLSQLGVDSLMGLEFKHQVDADLGVSLAMVRVLEGLPLDALAPELLEAMGRESRTGPAKGTAEPPEALLAKIDELTEDELDAALSSIMGEGGAV